MSAKQQYRRNQQIVEPARSSNVEFRAILGPKTSLQEAQQTTAAQRRSTSDARATPGRTSNSQECTKRCARHANRSAYHANHSGTPAEPQSDVGRRQGVHLTPWRFVQSVCGNWLVAIGWWKLVGSNWLVGGSWLVAVCEWKSGWWQLVGGNWLVAVGWWQLVGDKWLVGGSEEEEGRGRRSGYHTKNRTHVNVGNDPEKALITNTENESRSWSGTEASYKRRVTNHESSSGSSQVRVTDNESEGQGSKQITKHEPRTTLKVEDPAAIEAHTTNDE